MNRSNLLQLFFKFIAVAIVIGLVILLLTISMLGPRNSETDNSAQQPLIDSAIEQRNSTPALIEENTPSSYLFLAIFFLSLATTVSVTISFYLYRWRKILLANNNFVVPEQWGKHLISVREVLEGLSAIVSENMQLAVSESRDNARKIQRMTSTYMELNSALNEKDSEIRRLKSGYDADVFRKFVSRFVRVDTAVNELVSDGENTESLITIKRLLEDALDECGISKFEPALGDDYRNAFGVADNPKVKVTDDSNCNFKICEINNAGYHFRDNSENSIIAPAKVTIYKYSGEA